MAGWLTATYTVRSSGATWIPRGRPPTATVETTRSVAESITVSEPERSFETQTVAASAGGRGAAQDECLPHATYVRV